MKFQAHHNMQLFFSLVIQHSAEMVRSSLELSLIKIHCRRGVHCCFIVLVKAKRKGREEIVFVRLTSINTHMAFHRGQHTSKSVSSYASSKAIFIKLPSLFSGMHQSTNARTRSIDSAISSTYIPRSWLALAMLADQYCLVRRGHR